MKCKFTIGADEIILTRDIKIKDKRYLKHGIYNVYELIQMYRNLQNCKIEFRVDSMLDIAIAFYTKNYKDSEVNKNDLVELIILKVDFEVREAVFVRLHENDENGQKIDNEIQ